MTKSLAALERRLLDFQSHASFTATLVGAYRAVGITDGRLAAIERALADQEQEIRDFLDEHPELELNKLLS